MFFYNNRHEQFGWGLCFLIHICVLLYIYISFNKRPGQCLILSGYTASEIIFQRLICLNRHTWLWCHYYVYLRCGGCYCHCTWMSTNIGDITPNQCLLVGAGARYYQDELFHVYTPPYQRYLLYLFITGILVKMVSEWAGLLSGGNYMFVEIFNKCTSLYPYIYNKHLTLRNVDILSISWATKDIFCKHIYVFRITNSFSAPKLVSVHE